MGMTTGLPWKRVCFKCYLFQTITERHGRIRGRVTAVFSSSAYREVLTVVYETGVLPPWKLEGQEFSHEHAASVEFGSCTGNNRGVELSSRG